MMFRSINPANGELLASFQALSPSEVEGKLAIADQAARSWGRLPVEQRSAVLARLADLLDARREEYARLLTLEMGKTFRSALDEVAKCALACRYYASHASSFLAPQRISNEPEGGGEVRFDPLGPILAIMPWNFPFWQVLRFAAPALAAGNVVLLKHASNVPQCALALERLLRDATAPAGVFQTLLLPAERALELIGNQRVRGVTLTGSDRAGRAVAAAAGKHLKKAVLELGGSDAFVVLSSANVQRAAEVAVAARIINNGQSCIAAKRFIVVEGIAERFEQLMAERLGALRVGDPFDEATEVGPLATEQVVADLEQQVKKTLEAGARLVVGGKRLSGPGNYFQPTLLADVPLDSPAACEELFGPVAALFKVPDTEAAITLANASPYGLGASVWTSDPVEASRCEQELEAGLVFINGMVVSDPRYPFGGVKRSGYGRELASWGMYEFVNIKTVRRWGIAAAAPGEKQSP
jgi:succinate-semialdehyde dehydrogenase/glutarate-semialdehyde dehydrogenase